MDKLLVAYRKAMDHARFLLFIERKGGPCTFNHYFNSTLQEKRNDRLIEPMNQLAFFDSEYNEDVLHVSKLKKLTVDKSNDDQVCDDIFDAVSSYYKVARKRFVDNVCQQAILHMLLRAEDGPLTFFSSDMVMGLAEEELDAIAGEDEDSKLTRVSLEREIRNLEAAVKVLRV